MIKNSCIECHKKGIKRVKIGITLCSTCANLDKYTLITLTNSKKEYLLTDDDLDGLKYLDGKCAYGPATYYFKNDIIQKASEKFNVSPSELENYLESVKNAKKKIREERQIKAYKKKQALTNKRRDSLIKALNEAGLELRSDSQLCKKYINGDKDNSLDEVVLRMCQMKYLYDYCHMEKCKDIAYEEYKDDYRYGYYPDGSVHDRAESIALKKYSNSRYPDVFPWQNTKTL